MTTNSPKHAHIQVSLQLGTRRARYGKQEQTRVQGSGSRTHKPSWPQMTTNSPKRAHIQVSPQMGTRRASYYKQEQTRVHGSGSRTQKPSWPQMTTYSLKRAHIQVLPQLGTRRARYGEWQHMLHSAIEIYMPLKILPTTPSQENSSGKESTKWRCSNFVGVF